MSEDPIDQHIDAALRRTHAPGTGLASVIAEVAAAARRPAPRVLHGTRRAAAAVLVVALGLFVLWLVRGQGETARRALAVSERWHSTFTDAVANSYPAPGVCAPLPDLAGHCTERFDCPLRLAPADSLELCGFYCGSFCSVGRDEPAVLLLRANGEPVCVFVTLLARDPRPDLAALAERRLLVRRREVPPLVLYQLTRAEVPTLLERFSTLP